MKDISKMIINIILNDLIEMILGFPILFLNLYFWEQKPLASKSEKNKYWRFALYSSDSHLC